MRYLSVDTLMEIAQNELQCDKAYINLTPRMQDLFWDFVSWQWVDYVDECGILRAEVMLEDFTETL